MSDVCNGVAWEAAAAPQPLQGSVRVPGDKSISHRAMMLGAMAEGTTHVSGFLEGEDTRATAHVFQQLGVCIDTPNLSERIVHGVGLHGLHGTDHTLDCGNAGTGMRLLAGVLAGQRFDSVLAGDPSLSQRPMGRVINPLQAMGARIDAAPGGLPPLCVRGGYSLTGIDYTLPVASAQVKSAVLLAGLYANGDTIVREPHPTRDYTERMLQAFGASIRFSAGIACVSGGTRLRGTQVIVPTDFSSAAFFIVAATLVPGSELLLEAVGMNPRRTGLLAVLQLMGADIEIERAWDQGGEPVADLVVRHAPLHGIDVPLACVPDMIDEFPVLFVAAAAARGRTRVSGAAELRVKESDRIATMAAGLRALGIEVAQTADGAVIEGGHFRGGVVQSHGDHRIAMSFAVAAQIAQDRVQVVDVENVATSFPGFVALARSIGMELHPINRGD